MSIIDPKYRQKYTGEKDWFGNVMDDVCYTPTGPKGKSVLDINKLFDLAKANGIDAAALYGDQVDRKNAAGRLRMTIGNRLRPTVRANTGITLPDGQVVLAPAEWLEKNKRPVREAKPKAEKEPVQAELPLEDEEPDEEDATEEPEVPVKKGRRK